jgi:hypothetical protein
MMPPMNDGRRDAQLIGTTMRGELIIVEFTKRGFVE